MKSIWGYALDYKSFREFIQKIAVHGPQIWKHEQLISKYTVIRDSEQDTFALSTGETLEHGEVVPGINLSLQWIKSGDCMESHAHSWWHIFIIQSGTGLIGFGKGEPMRTIVKGDIILVPAWVEHHFENPDKDHDLVMLSLTNMLEQARASNFKVQNASNL